MSDSTVSAPMAEDGAVRATVRDTPSAPVEHVTHTPPPEERTWRGPDAQERFAILRAARTVAIVGASPNAARSSYFVATYLLSSSPFTVYFVNPRAKEILGRPVYPDLDSLPERPDIVDVFRRAEDTPGVVADAARVGAKTVWLQLGIWNEDAARAAEKAGMKAVMDRCIKIEHARFHGGLHLMGFNTGRISGKRPRNR